MGIATRTVAAWTPAPNQQIGLPGILDTNLPAVGNKFAGTDGGAGLAFLPIGTVAKFQHSTYGEGEFILLYGVASNAIGLLVTYNPLTGVVVACPNTANLNQPLAVSMTANTSTTTPSWYQISGAAVILKTGVPVTPNVVVYISGTAGRVKTTAASGKQIVNARTVAAATVAAGTSTITVLIQRPHAQGAVA